MQKRFDVQTNRRANLARFNARYKSQGDFARAAGFKSQGHMSAMLSGQKPISDTVARRIELALILSPGYMDYPHQLNDQEIEALLLGNFQVNRYADLPLLRAAQIQDWLKCLDPKDFPVDTWMGSPVPHYPRAFLFRAIKEALYPVIYDGDLTVIDPNAVPLEHDDLVLARLKNSEGKFDYVFRQYRYPRDAECAYLRRAEPPLDLVEVTDDIEIIGRVLARIQEFRLVIKPL